MDGCYFEIRDKLLLGAIDAQRIFDKRAPFDTVENERAYMLIKKLLNQIDTTLDKLEQLHTGKKCYAISERSYRHELREQEEFICPQLEQLPCIRIKSQAKANVQGGFSFDTGRQNKNIGSVSCRPRSSE